MSDRADEIARTLALVYLGGDLDGTVSRTIAAALRSYAAEITSERNRLLAERHSWREANDAVWRAFPKDLPGDEPGTIDASVWVAHLVAERDRLREALKQRCGGGTEYHRDGAISISYRFPSAKEARAFQDAITALSSPTPEGGKP